MTELQSMSTQQRLMLSVDNTGGFSYSGFKGYGNADERIDERGREGEQ